MKSKSTVHVSSGLKKQDRNRGLREGWKVSLEKRLAGLTGDSLMMVGHSTELGYCKGKETISVWVSPVLLVSVCSKSKTIDAIVDVDLQQNKDRFWLHILLLF